MDHVAGEVWVDREQELALLTHWLRDDAGAPMLVIGPRGVGKTALCRRFADLNRAHFPQVICISGTSTTTVEELRARIPQGGDRADLLILDDSDYLEPQVAAEMFHVLTSRRSSLRSLIVRSRVDFEPSSWAYEMRVMSLGNLTPSDMHVYLTKSLAHRQIDTVYADRIYGAVLERRADASAITPEFLRLTVRNFVSGGDVGSAVDSAAATYFRDVTRLAIVGTPQGFRVLPTLSLAAADLLTPALQRLPTQPIVVVPAFSRFWRRRLDEFERLVNDPSCTEASIQQFLERNDAFLKGIDYERVIAHPVLERDDDGDLIPDFFLKPLGSNLVDVLDLKLPKSKLVVGAPNRRRFSATVHEAVAQLREYRDYFERKDYRERVRGIYGVTGYRPTTIVLIGRSPTDVPEEKYRQIVDGGPAHLKIITYDELLVKVRAALARNLL